MNKDRVVERLTKLQNIHSLDNISEDTFDLEIFSGDFNKIKLILFVNDDGTITSQLVLVTGNNVMRLIDTNNQLTVSKLTRVVEELDRLKSRILSLCFIYKKTIIETIKHIESTDAEIGDNRRIVDYDFLDFSIDVCVKCGKCIVSIFDGDIKRFEVNNIGELANMLYKRYSKFLKDLTGVCEEFIYK